MRHLKPRFDLLSDREWDVISRVITEMLNKQIAARRGAGARCSSQKAGVAICRCGPARVSLSGMGNHSTTP